MRVGEPQPLEHLGGEGAQVDARAAQLAPVHPGEGEQVVDQLAHPGDPVADAAQMRERALSELTAGLLDQRLAEAVDRPQRGLEIVGHRVGERLELGVERGQLGGSQPDLVLEIRR